MTLKIIVATQFVPSSYIWKAESLARLLVCGMSLSETMQLYSGIPKKFYLAGPEKVSFWNTYQKHTFSGDIKGILILGSHVYCKKT